MNSLVTTFHAHRPGYLRKKSSKDKWQKRWFEANDHYLTYYKVTRRVMRVLVIRQWATARPPRCSRCGVVMGKRSTLHVMHKLTLPARVDPAFVCVCVCVCVLCVCVCVCFVCVCGLCLCFVCVLLVRIFILRSCVCVSFVFCPGGVRLSVRIIICGDAFRMRRRIICWRASICVS